MAFELQSRERAGAGIRRLARARIDAALKEIRRARPETVHEVRKHAKQVRGLLRLVRTALGDRLYEHENTRFRDLAHPLGEVRDAQALLQAEELLAQNFGHRVKPEVFAALERYLRANFARTKREILQRDHALHRAEMELRAARECVDSWPIAEADWSVVAAGLDHVYTHGRTDWHRARKTRADLALHEWRKQAKYARAMLSAIQPIWPRVLEAWIDDLHGLSDALGDDHDLVVMLQQLREAAGLSEADRKVLRALIHERRSELQNQAMQLGRQAYGASAEALLGCLQAQWKSWHRI